MTEGEFKKRLSENSTWSPDGYSVLESGKVVCHETIIPTFKVEDILEEVRKEFPLIKTKNDANSSFFEVCQWFLRWFGDA